MKEKIKPRTLIVCRGQTKIALKTTKISVPESFWNKEWCYTLDKDLKS